MRISHPSPLAALLALAGFAIVACGSAPATTSDTAGGPAVTSSTAAPDATGEAAAAESPEAPASAPGPVDAGAAEPSPEEPTALSFPGAHPDLGPAPAGAVVCSTVTMVVMSLNRVVCELPATPGMLAAGSLAYVVRNGRVIAVLRIDGESDNGVLATIEDTDGNEPAIGDPVVMIPAQG